MKLIVPVFFELGMLENLVRTPFALRLMKIVHIELPDKWRKIIVFEVNWENLFGKFGLIFNHEGEPVICPGDDFLHARFTEHLKNFHEESWDIEHGGAS